MVRHLTVRLLLLSLMLGVHAVTPGETLAAQPYPSKQIELVIPWPPGGRTDLTVRMIAPYLEKYLGQPVVVINKVGGGGLIGMNAVKQAKPDGYTLSSGGIALSSIQYEKKNAPSLWDFTWIARTYWTPLVLAVPASSPFGTVKELVDFARANPGRVKHANTGTGSSTHLASESFAKKLGIRITQVPYKGEGPAVVGLGGEEADFALGLMPAFRPLVEAGKLKILGVADVKRNELYPDVPTFAEQGAEFVSFAFEALHVPNGCPPEVLGKLSDAAKKALTDPELRAKFASIGLNLDYQPGPEFSQWLAAYDKEVKALMDELGLSRNN